MYETFPKVYDNGQLLCIIVQWCSSPGRAKTSVHSRFKFVNSSIVLYSVRKDFTGFATAALIAWKLIVPKAIMTASNPAATNIHQLMLIRYAKSCSQLCIIHQAMGDAMTKAIATSLMKSFESSVTIFDTDAPSTLRTPISFVRCAVEKSDKPNKPRHAIKMAKPANIANTFPNNLSLAYCALKRSSRKK